MNADSARILDLRPVTFVYNSDASETKQYGLIAEETDEVFPEIVVHDADGQPQTIQYQVLPVLLLNEMKKQQVTNAQRDALIQNLMERIQALEAKA
jgi:hypothetical protein